MDRTNIQSIFPLSGAQQAILFHQLQSDHQDPGLIQVQFRIDGHVDDAAMEAAWQTVLARQDGLRATVQIPKTQKPMVVVAKSARMRVVSNDLRNMSVAEQDRKIAALIVADSNEPLPLNRAPVGRVSVFVRGESRRDYLWTTQKILVDGVSAILVLQDVMAQYRILRSGVDNRSKPAPRLKSYYTFLNDQSVAEAEAFWAECFAGRSDHLPVFPDAGTDSAHEGSLEFGPDLWPSVEAAATSMAVTPSALISAAWALFLSAAGAGDDVAFALSLSGRPYDLTDHDRIVGPFATTAPRRVLLRDADTFKELVQGLHRAGFKSHRYETLSPHLMFGGSPTTRQVPLPDTLLTVETLPETDIVIDIDGGVALSGFRSDVASGFPLTIVVLPGPSAQIKYTTNGLQDQELADRILPVFPHLLAEAVSEPSRSVGALRKRFSHLSQSDARDPKTSTPAGIAPQSPMELAMAEIWKDVLGIDHVDMSRDFVGHGGRSFASMRVLTRIEEAFGKRIPMVDFIRAQTIPELVDLINREVGHGRNWKTLVPLRSAGEKPPILFVHLGQHPVTFLRPLVERLGPDQPFFAVQPVGVSGDAKPLTRFEDLARVHVEEFLSVAPDGPINVIGHCGGARLGVEVIRQLEANGRSIENFVVIDTKPPTQMDPPKPGPTTSAPGTRTSPTRSLVHRGARIPRALFRRARRGLKIGWAALSGKEELRREVKAELVFRACHVADMAYRARCIPDRVFVVNSNDSPVRDFKWKLVSENVKSETWNVGHYTLFFEPDVDILAKEIRRTLSTPFQDMVASSWNRPLD